MSRYLLYSGSHGHSVSSSGLYTCRHIFTHGFLARVQTIHFLKALLANDSKGLAPKSHQHLFGSLEQLRP